MYRSPLKNIMKYIYKTYDILMQTGKKSIRRNRRREESRDETAGQPMAP
jgi:hypothetical protein